MILLVSDQRQPQPRPGDAFGKWHSDKVIPISFVTTQSDNSRRTGQGEPDIFWRRPFWEWMF